MFNPSRDQVRQFFCEAWRKHRAREILDGAEAVAADLIDIARGLRVPAFGVPSTLLRKAERAPLGERGRNGVDSFCGASVASPNISDVDAW